MLLLWYASFLISIITLAVGISKRSWIYLLVSVGTSMPIAYYFFGANNAMKYIGLTPVVLLVVTIVFWLSEGKTKTKVA